MIDKRTQSRVFRPVLLPLPFMCGLALPPLALAQEEGSLFDEIVVTAQKREERLQDVPISIGVINSDTLGDFNLNETTDIQNLVPGVSTTNAAGPRNFGFFIRGIGTSSFASESIEGSSAFVVDGVVYGQAGASLTDLPDVERVEVLRGPQGTLFGKNASAGVINIVTRDPAEAFEFDGSVSFANPDNERKVSAVVTGPISDQVRYLVSARANQRDGYVDNVFDGREFNDRDDYGARAKLEITPADDLTVMVIADYWKRDVACCIWTLRDIGTAPSLTELESVLAGIEPGPENLQQNINGDVFADSESYGTSAQVDYEFGDGFYFTSITAWREWSTTDGLDSDSSTTNQLDVNFADFEQQQWTQEFRITSPQGNFFDYVAGLYFFDSEVASESTQLFPNVPLPFFSRLVNNEAGTRNLALFGQVNIHPTDNLSFILGGRVLQEKADASKRRFDPVFMLNDSASDSKTDRAVVWRAGVQYAFTNDIMAFATATRGYKGGGFDTGIALSNLPDVEPEEPISYEVGLRTSWLDQRAFVNVTVFDTDVEGYQVSARDAEQNVTFISNGESETRGVELDILVRPLVEQDLTLTLSAAYVDGVWGDFPNATCYAGQSVAQGCLNAQQDLTGERLPFSPEWTLSSALSYHREVFGGGFIGSFNLGASYRDDAGIQFPNSPFTLQESYTLVNTSLGLADAGGKWRVSLFGKNITDENYAVVMFATPFGGNTPQSLSQFIPYDAQRVVGVSLDVSL